MAQAPEPMNIFVKRILATKDSPNMQVLFEEHFDPVTSQKVGTKEPVLLYIKNASSQPVQCMSQVMINMMDTPDNIIICTSKSRVILKFKILLLVRYLGNPSPKMYVLPDELFAATPNILLDPVKWGKNTTTQVKNHTIPKETLSIINPGTPEETYFTYTMDIPLSEFNNTLTQEQLNDPTLQSHVLLDNMTYTLDVDGQGPAGGAFADTTMVYLSIFEDINDNVGIDQNIIVQGTPATP